MMNIATIDWSATAAWAQAVGAIITNAQAQRDVMTNGKDVMPIGDAGRTVYGPVIAGRMFFDVSGVMQSDATNPIVTARLRATDFHEIWLASCDDKLSSFEGALEIYLAPNGSTAKGGSRLVRTDAYEVKLTLETEALPELRADLLPSELGIDLALEFDVEYLQTYDSPGGYSAACGIRYWDDIVYPIVPIYGYRFGQATTG